MSKCEYLQKVLDVCKNQSESQRSVVLTNRSSLPLFDQKITVNLDTNKIVVEEDPNTLIYDMPAEESIKVEEIDETQQIIKVPVEILNKETPKHSTQFNKENLITSPKLNNVANQPLPKPPGNNIIINLSVRFLSFGCKRYEQN